MKGLIYFSILSNIYPPGNPSPYLLPSGTLEADDFPNFPVGGIWIHSLECIILLMFQKSQTPGMVLKPVANNGACIITICKIKLN